MKRVLLESSAAYVLVCVVVALLYSGIQYYRQKQQPWPSGINWILFAGRAVLTFIISFLLLGPIVKQINNVYEKSPFLIVVDNSGSVNEAYDSTARVRMEQQLVATRDLLAEKGYQAEMVGLNGETFTDQTKYDLATSDLHGALRKITNRFEGKNIGGVLLVTDGIYNSGVSPLYGAYSFPIHTVGLGDTTERLDVSIKNLAFNKIAYEGNRFPIRAEIQTKNITNTEVTVSLIKAGKVIEKITKKADEDALVTFDFQPLANEEGLQKFDVVVESHSGEENVQNNRASAFVEVVAGKKKILLVAPSPHPDVKALREVIEKNANYEFILHIPGITDLKAADFKPADYDLAIFYQSPDLKSRTTALFEQFNKAKTSVMLVLGQQSDLRQLERFNAPIRFESTPREFDEVTPVVNGAFSNFSISSEAITTSDQYPPAFVHFGKVTFPQTTTAMLYQKVGSIVTDKPLLTVDVADTRKTAIMLGEGLWRWRMHEFERTETTAAFDEIFGKLVQFLTTTDDKRKFRSYPVKQEFHETEPVVFESQVYNDIFEPVYGNKIEIIITEENGKRSDFSYVTSPGNTRYQIGGLKEGVYRYRSRTELNGKMEEVRGEFAVIEQQAEKLNLTADFGLLRKLAENTGGTFYKADELGALQDKLRVTEAKSIIHTEEKYDSVINLKWVFWLLLLLVGGEWFLRKFYGSY